LLKLIKGVVLVQVQSRAQSIAKITRNKRRRQADRNGYKLKSVPHYSRNPELPAPLT
jgi:hypothetical protein